MTPMKGGGDGFGAPLVKPEFQKQYNEKLNQMSQSSISKQAQLNQLNLTANKQMIS